MFAVTVLSLVFVLVPDDPDTMYAEFFREHLAMFPTLATSVGDHSMDDRYENDISEEHRAAQRELHTRYVERAVAIDRGELDDDARLNLDLFLHQRRTNLRTLSFDAHLVPINHHFCPVFDFAHLGGGDSYHPFDTVRDYDNFLSRIDGFEAWCETAVENMKVGMERGFVLPKHVARLTIARLRGIVVEDPRESSFFGPIRNMPADFSEDERSRLEQAYVTAIDERLTPLYRSLAKFVEDQYLPACRDSLGWSDLPDGEKWYAQLARFYTTTDLTPDEIFELGEREVARVGPLFLAAQERAKDHPRTRYETADEIVEAYRERLELARDRLDALFDVEPRTPLEFLPSKYGTYYEPGAPGSPGAPDESRPGVFRFYFDGPSEISEATFLHESIPGHHYQMMLQRESPQPDFRKHYLYYAFIEGWGLYSESLGPELGFYGDPHQQVERYYAELWRSLRLVWDVGLHAQGWSFEDCADYGAPYGLNINDMRGELERYVADPGQALSYKVGELKIIELRDRARAELGDAFDLRAFHALVLRTGAVPLDMLEQRVAAWIETQH